MCPVEKGPTHLTSEQYITSLPALFVAQGQPLMFLLIYEWLKIFNRTEHLTTQVDEIYISYSKYSNSQ